MNITLEQLGGVAGVTLLLTQVAKSLIKDSRLWPVVSISIGIILSVGLAFSVKATPEALVAAVLSGLTSGIVASGLWSSSRAIGGQ